MSQTIPQDINVTLDNTTFTFYRYDRIYGYMIFDKLSQIIFNNLYYYKFFNLSASLKCYQRDSSELTRTYNLIPYGQGEPGFKFDVKTIVFDFTENSEVTQQFDIAIETSNFFREMTAFQPMGFLLYEPLSSNDNVIENEIPSEFSVTLIPTEN